MLENALRFVQSQQGLGGAFGSAQQPRLQTALGMLAILSMSSSLDTNGMDRLTRAVAFFTSAGENKDDLGDEVYRVESHALATTALLCALPRLRDAALAERTTRTVRRALSLTQRMQDRSSSGSSHGGWKMEGMAGAENDRRASAWALLSYDAAIRYGLNVEQPYVDRGVRYLLGSFKRTIRKPERPGEESSDSPDQLGGLSVDAEGLAVPLITGMGGWALTRLDRASPEDIRKNMDWLDRHPPDWIGPNYYFANFFRVRALKFGDADGARYARTLRRLYLQVRENQMSDGQVRFPPADAPNLVSLGPLFPTAMAILILNVDDSRLVFDEDYRPSALR